MKSWLRIYCLLAGAGDAATGALLLAAPGRVTALLGLEPARRRRLTPRSSALSCWRSASPTSIPSLSMRAAGETRLRHVFETTAISRLAVASYLAAAILGGRLGISWAVVLATDLALGAFQVVWLRRTRTAA